jgi:hypothetical protein
MTKISIYRRHYGQFFTPDSVVAGCYALLKGALPAMPCIVDPACGDGAFLRYAATRAITERDRIAGCDVDAELVGALATGGLPGIRYADGLDPTSLPAASFDLVIGNPPYGVVTSNNAGLAPASEVRFLLRALELARPGGYVALLLPSGVLANERLRAMRAGLLGHCTVIAVIALPRATFRQTGTSAACSILLLRNAPAAPEHHVFFGLPERLDDLPEIVAAYHNGASAEIHPSSNINTETPGHGDTRTRGGLQPNAAFWLPQTSALARRMDAHFWRPDHLALLEGLAARHPLRPLGELIDRRHDLIVGDHVRSSRGEAKGPGLPYEYYQTREFMAAGYNYAAIERCDERAYRRLRPTAVHRHDILVSCAGVGGAGQGRVCLVTHAPGPSCTGDVFILRVTQPDPIVLYLFLATRAGRAQLLRLQNGVGTVNLSADELLQVEVPLISAAAQRGLAARYAPVAAAHESAMAALLRGERQSFEHERVRSEALLGELKRQVEQLLIGD